MGRTLLKDFDLDRIFGEEGVQIIHLSGLIGALSPETGLFCLELARAAKKYGTRISFDLNYRASFWKNRETELREIFTEIAGIADILEGNEEDYQLCLGIEGPEAGGKDLAAKIEGFKGMIERVKKAFPLCSVFATTLREVARRHIYGAQLMSEEISGYCATREIHSVTGLAEEMFCRRIALCDSSGMGSGKMIQFAWRAERLQPHF